MAIISPFVVAAQPDEPVIVNVDNFARAETAAQFDRMLEYSGGVNKWFHVHQPTPLDQQTVIRMNRDTLYSMAIVDISKGATLTLPEVGERYMTAMIVNQDHFIKNVQVDFRIQLCERYRCINDQIRIDGVGQECVILFHFPEGKVGRQSRCRAKIHATICSELNVAVVGFQRNTSC